MAYSTFSCLLLKNVMSFCVMYQQGGEHATFTFTATKVELKLQVGAYSCVIASLRLRCEAVLS